jgi:hypothetical protein
MIDIVFETPRFNLTESGQGSVGEDVLRWMSSKLELHGAETLKIYSQRWGWEMEVRHNVTTYLIGTSGRRSEHPTSPNSGLWRITVTKRRSMLDRALGKNRMSKTDPLAWLVESALHAETDITNVRREASAA